MINGEAGPYSQAALFFTKGFIVKPIGFTMLNLPYITNIYKSNLINL